MNECYELFDVDDGLFSYLDFLFFWKGAFPVPPRLGPSSRSHGHRVPPSHTHTHGSREDSVRRRRTPESVPVLPFPFMLTSLMRLMRIGPYDHPLDST